MSIKISKGVHTCPGIFLFKINERNINFKHFKHFINKLSYIILKLFIYLFILAFGVNLNHIHSSILEIK